MKTNIIFSFFPLHVGMRWYWKDFASMENWARSDTHRQWWIGFLKDTGGTGFWHETYTMNGGLVAIYDDVSMPLGFKAFAPLEEARGSMFSARSRSRLSGEPPEQPEGTKEQDLY